MDPNFNSVWSAFEINMAKSLITSHLSNNTYTNDTNKKHSDFVDDLQAMFPWKENHQVTNLYIELVVEMTTAQSNNQHVAASSALLNNNFGMPTEAPAMDNMHMLQGYLMDDMEAMRPIEGQHHMLNVVPKQRRHTVKFWTIDEHRYFIFALIWKLLSHL